MKRSSIKMSIEYRTQGMNVKQEHFKYGSKADSLFNKIKLILEVDDAVSSINQAILDVMNKSDNDYEEDESEDIRPWTAGDERRITCSICRCTFEDWQTASCHLSKYHLYNCEGLKQVPPTTLTISSLWFNTMLNYMATDADTCSMEDKFHEYVLKHTYDWQINELSDGIYAEWWTDLQKEEKKVEE